jgi:hypothetical protein
MGIDYLHMMGPNRTSMKSACDNELQIKTKAYKLELEIRSVGLLEFDPYVITNGPSYIIIILGTDVILRYPYLLPRRLNDLNISAIQRIATLHTCQKEEEDVVKRYSNLFKTEISEMTICKRGKHCILLNTDNPVSCKFSRIPIHYTEGINKEVLKNLKLGITRKSSSPWCSPIVAVPKPDRTLRMCIDYRSLNKLTIKDKYLIPRIDDIIDNLAGATIFSRLDATSSYYQIEMNNEDRQKTAFAWKGGLYEFNRMPFELCNDQQLYRG